MFEHLDDPAGFAPTTGFRDAVARRGRRLRVRRRLGRAATATAVALTAVAVGGVAYVDHRDDAIDRVDIASPASLDGAVNILLVGTDAREAAGPEARADTVIVLRLAEDGSISLLAIPRDLAVPGTGERISATYAAGGAQGLVDAITALGGIPVDHYAEIGLDGFVGLVDDLGGLDLTVDRHLEDRSTGLSLPPGECRHLDGTTVLQLVRSRHIPGDSDLNRLVRTMVVIRSAVEEMWPASPRELDRMARTLADHAVLDEGLSLSRLVELGRAVDGGRGLTGLGVLPVTVGEEQPSILLPAPEAGAAFEAFGGSPTTTTTVAGQSVRPPPATVAVPDAAGVGIRACDG